MTEQEVVKQIRQGLEVAGPKIIDRRTRGLALVRRRSSPSSCCTPRIAASRASLRYLNTRYFRFPEGVTVKAREGWELPRSETRHNFLRVVEGQGAWLDKNSECSGTLATLRQVGTLLLCIRTNCTKWSSAAEASRGCKLLA